MLTGEQIAMFYSVSIDLLFVGSWKLDYDSVMYGPAKKSYSKLRDSIHNQGLRLCLGTFRTFSAGSLFVVANDPSLYL